MMNSGGTTSENRGSWRVTSGHIATSEEVRRAQKSKAWQQYEVKMLCPHNAYTGSGKIRDENGGYVLAVYVADKDSIPPELKAAIPESFTPKSRSIPVRIFQLGNLAA